MQQNKQPLCRQCGHFYITWDKQYPYGCKAMGFKSERLPCLVVREASGLECQFFAAKEKKG